MKVVFENLWKKFDGVSILSIVYSDRAIELCIMNYGVIIKF